MIEPLQVLVLGGGGLLGPRLCSALLRRGYAVHCFNRGRSAPRIPAGVRLWRGDRTDPYDIRILADVPADVVIDTTAWYGATLPAILSSVLGRASLYVFMSSIAVYAPAPGRLLTEDSPAGCNPAWGPIGAEKRRCEEACLNAAAKSAASVVVLRLAHLFIPDDPDSREGRLRSSLRNAETVRVPGDGGSCLQFVDGWDVTDACLQAIERRGRVRSGVFNIAGRTVWTIVSWVQAWSRTTGMPARIQHEKFEWGRRREFLYWPGDVAVSAEAIERELAINLRDPNPGWMCDSDETSGPRLFSL